MKITLKRTFIVLFVTLLISLALLPLSQTSWAQDMRGSLRGPEGGQAVLGGRGDSAERLESLNRIPTEIGIITGFLRPALFLLIPGSITVVIHRAIKNFFRSRPHKPLAI